MGYKHVFGRFECFFSLHSRYLWSSVLQRQGGVFRDDCDNDKLAVVHGEAAC